MFPRKLRLVAYSLWAISNHSVSRLPIVSRQHAGAHVSELPYGVVEAANSCDSVVLCLIWYAESTESNSKTAGSRSTESHPMIPAERMALVLPAIFLPTLTSTKEYL